MIYGRITSLTVEDIRPRHGPSLSCNKKKEKNQFLKNKIRKPDDFAPVVGVQGVCHGWVDPGKKPVKPAAAYHTHSLFSKSQSA